MSSSWNATTRCASRSRSRRVTSMVWSTHGTSRPRAGSARWYAQHLPLLSKLTSRQLDKYKKGDFGRCPRVSCITSPLLPTGLSDVPNTQTVKLYCPRCEDLYNPKSSRHASIDGAYFGTSFPNILFQVYPALSPDKSAERYQPKVFGFKVHAAAALQRWQEKRKDEMLDRLSSAGIDSPFAEDDGMDYEDDEDPDGGEL